jgi:poly-beta-1,6-N-acetyl-D-glucosamine synthase
MGKFCVIVPAHNEAVMIGSTLRGLMAAGALAGDIYLIDDYSSDATGDIGRELGVNVHRNDPNLGKAMAVQYGVRAFKLSERYEFIALMDADTLIDVSYFAEMLKSFEDPEVVVACGRPISVKHNWLTAYRALCYANGHYVYRRAQGKIGMVCIAPGCATMYRSSIFDQLDWENGTVAEDMHVTIQVHHEHLGKVAYVVGAKVYTQTPRDLQGYNKQMLRWYTGTWQVIRKQRVFFGNQLVDWECKLLWTEGFITAVFRVVIPLLALLLPFFAEKLQWLANAGIVSDGTIAYYIALATPWYSGLEALLLLTVGGYLISLPAIFIFAYLERRWDIVKYSLTYPLIRYVDVWFFLRGFWRAIIQNKEISIKWSSPTRYVEKGSE